MQVRSAISGEMIDVPEERVADADGLQQLVADLRAQLAEAQSAAAAANASATELRTQVSTLTTGKADLAQLLAAAQASLHDLGVKALQPSAPPSYDITVSKLGDSKVYHVAPRAQ